MYMCMYIYIYNTIQLVWISNVGVGDLRELPLRRVSRVLLLLTKILYNYYEYESLT